MKYLINITILLFAFASCKAQTPIVGLDAPYSTPSGAYLKDLNNELDKFVGTWIFTDGIQTLTITFQKKEMVYGIKYFRDKLFGEYEYAENNNVIINTLPQITQTPNDISNRNIGGGYIITNDLYVACDNCSPNERRIKLYFNDPERSYLSASIILRYLSDGDPFGQGAQMTATIISNGGGILTDENSPTELRVPYGEYLMVKE